MATVFEQSFENILKAQAWAREIDGKFIPMLGEDQIGSPKSNIFDAIELAKEQQMRCLADIASFIVGEGNTYRGIVADSVARGN